MSSSVQKAFTMIELVFVILIVSILSIFALPRLMQTKDNALISNTKNTIATIRASISTTKQRRALHGDFTPLVSLSTNEEIFGGFNGDPALPVLDYGVTHCTTDQPNSCWQKNDDQYIFILSDGHKCLFRLRDNRFIMQPTDNKQCHKIDR